MPLLLNRSIVVTGAAQGIGKATAIACAKEGAHVVVCDINGGLVREVAAEITSTGGKAIAVEADCSAIAAVRSIVATTLAEFGSVDGLVCGGMRRIYGPAESFSDADWDIVIDQGLTGYFRCAREVGRQMLEQRRGAIVFVTSIAGQNAVGGGAAYCSAKAGIAGLTRQLGVEWAPRGIRTNAVAPGFTITEGAQRVMSPDEAAALIPLGRPAEAREIANVCLFLLSDSASHITAQEIIVDGGYTSVRALDAGTK